jgi:putative ABC transport system permease protein
MILHYLRILLRKQPVFAALNFGGLVLGMSTALLLYRYVRYEQDYDRQSPHAAHIWRVFNQTLDGATVVMEDANTHSAVGPTLKADVAGVLDFARLYCGQSAENVALVGQQPFQMARVYATDPGFLRMFPQRFLTGEAATCLDAPHAALLTRSNAERMFGSSEAALGQVFRVGEGMLAGQYTVQGVVADPPESTHLKFDALLSYATRYASGFRDNFDSYWDYNYLQLAPGTDPEALRQRLARINDNELRGEGIRLEIQPFRDIHLHSKLSYELEPNGSARTVRFLGLIALLILGIAFINYVNLTTALAGERAREVGVRKAIGASRGALARQFLAESAVLSGAAFVVSAACFQVVLPDFGVLVGRPLHAEAASGFWLPALGLTALLALLAGLYPALQLSAFRPVEALRGRVGGRGAEGLRRGLVLLQFACSAALIFGVLVVGQQLRFLRKYDLGVSLDQVLSVKTPSNDSLSAQKLALFKDKCARLPGLRGQASSNVAPGLGINGISGSSRPIRWTQKPDFARVTSYFVETDEQFFELLGIRVLAGAQRLQADRRQRFNVVGINRAMLEALGFPSPEAAIGQQIAYENSEQGATMTVGAVIENFHIESLKTKPQPTLYYTFAPEELRYLSLKIDPERTAETLAAMQAAWRGIYPGHPFRYWFLDAHFAEQYRAETQFGRVFGLFAGLAIAISCLGLLGLTAFNVRRRTKEIGIRKVLGASVAGIAGLLAKDLLRLVAIAVVVALPVAWFFMQKWLADFAYRIEMRGWMLAGAGALALATALLTVGLQSVRAALANPVKSLRSE